MSLRRFVAPLKARFFQCLGFTILENQQLFNLFFCVFSTFRTTVSSLVRVCVGWGRTNTVVVVVVVDIAAAAVQDVYAAFSTFTPQQSSA